MGILKLLDTLNNLIPDNISLPELLHLLYLIDLRIAIPINNLSLSHFLSIDNKILGFIPLSWREAGVALNFRFELIMVQSHYE